MTEDLDMSSMDRINRVRRKRKKNSSQEESIQVRVVRYLVEKYPSVLFRADVAAGSRQSIGMAVKMKKLGGNTAGWPDLFVAQPASGCHGLFLELKREGVRIHKRDGSFASDHLAEQAEVLQRLREAGYRAEFAIGFEAAVSLINEHLEGHNPATFLVDQVK